MVPSRRPCRTAGIGRRTGQLDAVGTVGVDAVDLRGAGYRVDGEGELEPARRHRRLELELGCGRHRRVAGPVEVRRRDVAVVVREGKSRPRRQPRRVLPRDRAGVCRPVAVDRADLGRVELVVLEGVGDLAVETRESGIRGRDHAHQDRPGHRREHERAPSRHEHPLAPRTARCRRSSPRPRRGRRHRFSPGRAPTPPACPRSRPRASPSRASCRGCRGTCRAAPPSGRRARRTRAASRPVCATVPSRSVSRTCNDARRSPVYSDRSEVRITFERLNWTRPSVSSAPPGVPRQTAIRRTPPSATAPGCRRRRRRSGSARPGPAGCTTGSRAAARAAVRPSQPLKAGTSDTRKIDAPEGRTWVDGPSTGSGCQSPTFHPRAARSPAGDR